MRRKREHNLEKKRGGCETENKEVVLELVGAELGIGYNWLEEWSIYIQFCFGKEGGTNKQKHTHSNSLIFWILSAHLKKKVTHTKILTSPLAPKTNTIHIHSLAGRINLSLVFSLWWSKKMNTGKAFFVFLNKNFRIKSRAMSG